MPTNSYGFVYPLASNTNDVPADLKTAEDSIGPYTVMRFATAAARDVLLTAPVAGQLAWLDSDGAYTEYGGTRWFPRKRFLTAAVTNSANITGTELVTDTITVALVAGVRYKIVHDASWQSTVGGDGVLIRLRQDNVTGGQLQGYRVLTSVAAAEYAGHIEGFYTAAATGSKTFVATSVRSGGTGTVNRVGAATTPSNLYVEPWD
jgi:hypothetical protein